MLVLSRKEGESILIGNDIRITIVEVRDSGRVGVAVSAPVETVVLREELIQQDVGKKLNEIRG